MSDQDLAEHDGLDTVELDEKPSIKEQAPAEAPAPSEPVEGQPPTEEAPPEGIPEEAPQGEAIEGTTIEETPAEPEEVAEPEVVYGGFDGPDSEYITLVSSDRHRFVIKRSLAIVSGTIRQMLISPGPETPEEEKNVIRLTIPSHLVERICLYLIYRDFFSKSEASAEDFDFVVEPYLAYPLLMAANFLTC